MKYLSAAVYCFAFCAAISAATALESCEHRQLTPTVTFISAACEGTLSFVNAKCWAPHLPTQDDIVLFPADTKAEAVFSWIYTPLRVKSVVVAKGASLTLRGNAMQATECFQIFGDVNLKAADKTDNTAASTEPFAQDKTAPLGVDCSILSRGYTPRICGPGVVVVAGRLSLVGHRASLFAPTRVTGTGVVEFQRLSYLWAALDNSGTIESDGLFLQGVLTNEEGGRIHVTSLRIERFALMDKFRPVTIVNKGTMAITSPDASAFWKYLSQKDNSKTKKELTKLKFVNEGQLSMSNLHYAHVFAGIDLDMFNVRGTITWMQNHDFYLTGSMVNSNGILIADQANVFLNDYVSQDGLLSTKSGGWFHFGSAAGVDTKTTVLCEKKQKKLVKRVVPVQLPVHPFVAKVSNVSCNPSQWDSCPSGLCCGAHGYCEEPRCQNADGYGGGPVCCPDNAFCGGSSHGPYCGAGIFSWEVDPECMAELEYVDRFEFEVMQTRFPAMELPKFGKHRYTMRGASSVESDGTGGVAFTESIEVRDSLDIRRGATLSNLMDNGAVPFAGKGRVSINGRFVGGIKSTFDGNQNIDIEESGRMEVPSYGTIWLHDSASLNVKKGGSLLVDGKIFVIKKTGEKEASGVTQCGTLSGTGGIVADVPLACNQQQ